MTRGVPIGFKHNWTYRGAWKEKKVGKGKWKGRFRATKSGKTAVYDTDFKFTKTLVKANMKKGPQGPKKGSELLWKIVGYQKAKKRIARKKRRN